MLPDLFIETKRLIIITLDSQSNSKNNIVILKNQTFSKENINIDEIYKNNTVVGYINIDNNNYIEYEIYKPFRNNGYAVEMLIAVKEFCLSQKVSPNLWIDKLNEKSKNTAIKSGFIYEGPYKNPNTEKWGVKK